MLSIYICKASKLCLPGLGISVIDPSYCELHNHFCTNEKLMSSKK